MGFFRFVPNPQRISAYIKDSEKKRFFLVLKELVVLTFTKKEIPYYYFKHLYKKEVKNIKDYLGTRERALVRAEIEKKFELASMMQNKLSFAKYCEKFGFKSPIVVGHNFSNHFFIRKEVRNIQTAEHLTAYFKDVFKIHGLKQLFVRPMTLMKGTGCFKLTLDNLDNTLIEQSQFLLNGSYIFTEVVEQHAKINEIHAVSVNTLRLLTLMAHEGGIKLVSAAMRFGTNNSVVDNSNYGGFMIGIDIKQGTLKEAGWNRVEYGRKRITHHPTSNYKLKGFKIPFYKEASDMVIEFNEYIPNQVIGWDVAITPDGPTIIEANHNPSLFLSDTANEGLLKNPDFKKLVDEVTNRI